MRRVFFGVAQASVTLAASHLARSTPKPRLTPPTRSYRTVGAHFLNFSYPLCRLPLHALQAFFGLLLAATKSLLFLCDGALACEEHIIQIRLSPSSYLATCCYAASIE